MGEPDLVQRDGGERSTLVERHPGVEHPIGDVVECGLSGEQEELLEHEADVLGTQGGQILVGQHRHVVSGDSDFAHRGTVERAHDMQQRRLSAAGGADDRNQFTVRDLEVDAAQGSYRGCSRVLLDDAAQFERRANRRVWLGDGHGTTTCMPSRRSVDVTSTNPSANRPGSTATSTVPESVTTSTA